MADFKNGVNNMDSLELIQAGKKLQEQAAFLGLRCPQYNTATAIRFASKTIYVMQLGPTMTPEMRDVTQRDLELIKTVFEGDRADLFNKLITHGERLADKLATLKTVSDMDGTPVLSDADTTAVEQARECFYKAKRSDAIRIR